MLFPTKNSLPEDVRTQVIDILRIKVACASDLKSQAKQAHWNLKGPHFIALHELFDKVADAADEFTDTLAERVMQLGGTVDGTIKSAAAATRLPDYPANIFQGQEHLIALSTALAQFGTYTRYAIDEVLGLNDQVTGNILIEICTQVDKLLWFLEAHLQVPSA
jgi:starvation-inducible DNA-binding protein